MKRQRSGLGHCRFIPCEGNDKAALITVAVQCWIRTKLPCQYAGATPDIAFADIKFLFCKTFFVKLTFKVFSFKTFTSSFENYSH